ncbi:MAG: hypothetical protein IPL15_16160 [Comamonadaceae bacterium]|uniref:hypothetical protein n=1 Tax=Candidatus Skiveiella danica TaxID=3386177 RepID=UPI003908C468|nr:hypothetical protein [Comamonadaceae bacterium]
MATVCGERMSVESATRGFRAGDPNHYYAAEMRYQNMVDTAHFEPLLIDTDVRSNHRATGNLFGKAAHSFCKQRTSEFQEIDQHTTPANTDKHH